MALSKKKNNESKNMHFSREDQKKILSSSSPFIVKEAYSSIRTNLLFSQKGDECPVFIVTSPTANNGKSINSVNMAVSFAQMGKKTLLIDADMRNPTVHRLFSIPVKNGLSEILAGLTDNITVSKTDIENLSVLTAGKIPPNPSELLSSERTDKLLAFVKQVGFVLNDATESNGMKYYSYGKYRGYKYKSKYGYNYNYHYNYR